MTPQTSVGGHRRFGIAALTALGVVAASVAGHAWHTTRLTPAADRDVLVSDFVPEFGAAGPANQIATLTVMNDSDPAKGQSVSVRNVMITVQVPAGLANPWRIVPGEDCTGATIAPQRYCVVSLAFTPVSNVQDIRATVALTLGDGSVFNSFIGATTDTTLDVPSANPIQLNYGNVTVNTTTLAQTVTLNAPANFPAMIMSVRPVPLVNPPHAAADYQPTADGCTNVTLTEATPTCTVGVTATPHATGNRPAFLDIAYCDTNSFNRINNDTGTPDVVIPSPVLPGQEQICGEGDGFPIIADHILIALTANGVPPKSNNPPPSTTSGPATLTANPAVAPAGRTTMVTGTGFPDNTPVTLALVPVDTPATTNLAAIPGSVSVTTNGIGGFANQLMLIMPHTTPGVYEIMGVAGATNAVVAFLVAPGIQEPPKFVTRH